MSKKRALLPQSPPVSSGSSSSGAEEGNLLKDKDTRRASEKKRRDEVNLCMDELITLLTMSGDRSCPKKLDKASVLKECCRFVRFYHNLSAIAGEGNESTYKPTFVTRGRAFSDLLDSLDAFSFVVSRTGQILFATEMMLSCLGFTHRLMVGHTINEFLHRDDCAVLGEIFNEIASSGCVKDPLTLYPAKQLTCRFRLNTEDSRMGVSCILMTFASFIYMRGWSAAGPPTAESADEPTVFEQPEIKTPPQDTCMILVAIPSSITHRDVPLLSNEFSFVFQMRISKEGTVLDVDKHSPAVLGYTQNELVGSSVFDYIHPYHVASFGDSVTLFIEQGYGSTNPFRLNSKGGRWIWITANGYATYNPWNQKGEHLMLECKVLGIDEVDTKQKIWVDSNYVPTVTTAPISAETTTTSTTKTTTTTAVTNPCTSSLVFKPVQSQQPPSPGILSPSEASSTSKDSEVSRKELERQLQEKNRELFESKQRILEQQRELYEEKDRFQRLLNVTLKLPASQSFLQSEQDYLSEFLLAPRYPVTTTPSILPMTTSSSAAMHHPTTVHHSSNVSTYSPYVYPPVGMAKHSELDVSSSHNQTQDRLLRLIDSFQESGMDAAYSLDAELHGNGLASYNGFTNTSSPQVSTNNASNSCYQ